MTNQNMNMEQIRGRIPLNIDYSGSASGGFIKHRDLHHNMNYNIFEEPIYVGSNQSQSFDTRQNEKLQQAVDFVQSQNPNGIDQYHRRSSASIVDERTGSPIKYKGGKMGALYNPNSIDPRAHIENLDEKPLAGVKTNYGPDGLERKHYDRHSSGARYESRISKKGNQPADPLFAQGPGTGTFVPGKVAALQRQQKQRPLYNSTSLKNAGLRAMQEGGNYGPLADSSLYRQAQLHNPSQGNTMNKHYRNEAPKTQDYPAESQSAYQSMDDPTRSAPRSPAQTKVVPVVAGAPNGNLLMNSGVPVVQRRHFESDKMEIRNIYRHNNLQRDNSYNNEADVFSKEQLLLEQDAHLLEEQRYLNRLKNSELKQNNHFQVHYNNILKPTINMRKQKEDQENATIQRRLQTYEQFQQEKLRVKQHLNSIHSQQLHRQIASANKRRADEEIYRLNDRKHSLQKEQIDSNNTALQQQFARYQK